MEQTAADRQHHAVAKTLGTIGLAGCCAAIFADLAGAGLSNHVSIIRDTISDAAAGGRYDWLVDAGLFAFAASSLAVAAGLWRWKDDGADWRAGQIGLVLLAVLITLIAAYEAYNREGGLPDIHIYLVGALGLVFPATVWLTASGLADRRNGLRHALKAFAVIWLVLGPGLYLVPTAIDGLYERALALGMVGWYAVAAWMVWTRPGEAG